MQETLGTVFFESATHRRPGHVRDGSKAALQGGQLEVPGEAPDKRLVHNTHVYSECIKEFTFQSFKYRWPLWVMLN